MARNKENSSELAKIADFLVEIETLYPTNPDLVSGKQFFEIWENACEPRPFSIPEKSVQFGEVSVNLPSKGAYTGYMGWDAELNAPCFFAENQKAAHRFKLRIQDGNIRFEKLPPILFENSQSQTGEETEVVYDVIDRVLGKKPGVDILKLTKKEFTITLDECRENYDKQLISRMSGLSAGKIKELVAQAASDMAIDDLSNQISLPFGSGSFAMSGSTSSPDDTVNISHAIVPEKSTWQVIQELELLANMSRLVYEAEKQFVFPLKDCEVIGHGENNGIQVKIPVEKDLPLREGSLLNIHKRGVKEGLGTFIVQIYDYDTIYGELFWDDPEETMTIEKAYIKPLQPPQRFLMQKTAELFSLVKNQPENLEGALPPILGLRQIGIAGKTSLMPPEGMDFSQKDAWDAAVNPANPVVAIQGPPGTGKTWVLAQVVRELIGNGNRILVTAPSNTAVDNICRRLSDLPVLRFGREEKVHPEVKKSAWAGDETNLLSFLEKHHEKKGRVFAATHIISLVDKTITEDLQQNGLFDVVIFDEAGMSRMDEFLLCAQLGKRVILFGDQQQLPPFPLSTLVLKRLKKEDHLATRDMLQIVMQSALEWLSENRKLGLFMLKRSYRCQNPRLLRFSSTLFYHAKVKTSEKAEYFRLPYRKRKEKYPPSTLLFYRTSALPETVRQEKIIFDGAKTGIENLCEAAIVCDILRKAIPLYPLNQITVISPYKRQTHLIKKLLLEENIMESLGTDIPSDQWTDFLQSRISTVDSFQGGESDLVIISYVRSNQRKGIGFVDNPNRINVAHTRCRREIIIVGDLECLKNQAKTDIFIKMERAFSRDGNIIDVEEKDLWKEFMTVCDK